MSRIGAQTNRLREVQAFCSTSNADAYGTGPNPRWRRSPELLSANRSVASPRMGRGAPPLGVSSGVSSFRDSVRFGAL